MTNRWEKWKQCQILFSWATKSLWNMTAAMKLKKKKKKKLVPWKKSYDQHRQHVKKQRHYFASKVHLVKTMIFPVVMYGYES